MRETILKDKIFWLLLFFAAAYILGNINSGTLTTWDEALYANISREIVKDGSWLVVHQPHQKPWFDKPPLYMWCTAVSYKIFGVSEFSTRLASALFGIAAVMLLYSFAKRIFDEKTALLSGLLLLAFPHYVHFAKLGMMDAPITFLILLFIYLYWLGQEREDFLFYAGIVLVIAYFMKGFAAFLAPLIIICYSIFSGNIRLLFNRKFLTGLATAFVVIGLWHLVQFLLAGPAALKEYFGFHIYQRATSAIESHGGGMNFYQKVIFNKNIPWSVIIYPSIFFTAWLAFKYKDKRAILILSWVAVSYLLYSLVRTKLPWYIMPVYPALAVSSAIMLARFFKNRAFYLILGVILIGMLIQPSLSWAFKLDFTPDVKIVASYAKELKDKGNDIYIIGAANSELFYCDFAKVLDKDMYESLRAKGIKTVYCIILPSLLDEKARQYSFDYKPIYQSKRLSFYRLTFKE